MPLQLFWDHDGKPASEQPHERRALALIFAVMTFTALATCALYSVLARDTLGPLDAMILAVFAPLFAWTAFSFASALAGLLASSADVDPLRIGAGPAPARLATRTAILSAIYNERPAEFFARQEAMWTSLQATGLGSAFDIFVLSDTTNGAIRRSEAEYFAALRRRLPRHAGLFYRHRTANTDRKAGNIADWVRRFGGAYDFMVVLDADSLMEGQTLTRLAAAMQANPRLGLIQTTPLVINRHSLFARTEQFASRLYGPLLARGLSWWSGPQANYWGHNAILRVRAFAASAGLPHLPGKGPFGGHILSHDFVEAALICRAGWEVRMAPMLGGSYEECPPTLGDAIARDRRWCQGNLQHIKVLRAAGLSWISRLHLLRGIFSYLTAPLWLALLVMGALLALKPTWGVSDAQLADQRLLAGANHGLPIAAIFILSMVFLLAPKLMAYGAMVANRQERALFGGAGWPLASMALEIVLSALTAPVLMLNQVWALASIIAGRDAGWSPQHREEGVLTLEDAANRHLGDTAVGLALAVSALGASTHVFLWMLPVILGLLFCIPLSALTSRCDLGALAFRARLLVIPDEVEAPAVVRGFNALRQAPRRLVAGRVMGSLNSLMAARPGL